MKKLLSYAALQLRRAARLLPRMLAVTLLLAVLTALAGLLFSRLRDDGADREPVRVALSGAVDGGMVGEALELLKSMDSSRFSLSLEPMEEAAAERALRAGTIDGLLLVPEGFAEAMMIGEHRPMTYVTLSGGADLGAQLVRELAETVSSLVLETENAVYGAQDYAAAQGEADPWSLGDRLVFRYALRILDRGRLYTLDTEAGRGMLSLPGSLLCGLSLLFVMLWAVGGAPFYTRRSRELGRVLQADGLGAAAQVLAEYLSSLLLMLCGLLAAGLLAGLLLGRFGLSVPELEGKGAGGVLRFALGALPTALMLCALQFLLYELADGAVAGVLLQFLNAVCQGYLAGCFYPNGFFPEGLRRFGAWLPAGAGMAQMRELLLPGEPSAAGPVWLWLALFLALSVLFRFRRNRS